MTTTTTNYAEMLHVLYAAAATAAAVEGAETVGAFIPIGRFGESRQFGEFSSLSEFLIDFAEVLSEFLDTDGEELDGWEA